ncbi:MAG: glutathione S-transferase family protein [Hyphomonadaceae bacterium]|nr:glutathione S-transferase family protein [Hyphomonadaceae bacterium]
MKLYTAHAPNPLRVNAFIHEKGIDIPTVRVDIMAGETREAAHLARNPLGELPVLELDDGTHISESLAICRYLEALYPEPSLFGSTPKDAAIIEMWTRRMELLIMESAGNIGRHLIPIFADKYEQMPDYAETQKRALMKHWAWLNDDLSDGRTYIALDQYSVADITAMGALFVMGFMQMEIPDSLEHVKRWESAVRAKPVWEGPNGA